MKSWKEKKKDRNKWGETFTTLLFTFHCIRVTHRSFFLWSADAKITTAHGTVFTLFSNTEFPPYHSFSLFKIPGRISAPIHRGFYPNPPQALRGKSQHLCRSGSGSWSHFCCAEHTYLTFCPKALLEVEAKDRRSPGERRQTVGTLTGTEVYRLSLQRWRGEENHSMGVKKEVSGPIYSSISLPLILIGQSKTSLVGRGWACETEQG